MRTLQRIGIAALLGAACLQPGEIGRGSQAGGSDDALASGDTAGGAGDGAQPGGDNAVGGGDTAAGDSRVTPGDELVPGDAFTPGDAYTPGDVYTPGDSYAGGESSMAGDSYSPPGDSNAPPGDDAAPGDDMITPGDSAVSALCAGITPVAGRPRLRAALVANVPRVVDITAPREDTSRLFVVDQNGRIRIVTMPGDTLLTTPFLDITGIAGYDGSEQGLLALVFHPQYATNRRFFVFYTTENSASNIVAEYTASIGNPNVANTTGTPLITIPNEQSNHNGGGMAFGPDGLLYIASGDGGVQNDPDLDSRDYFNLLGKILRLDVDRPSPHIPPSNPYADGVAGHPAVFSIGFRNPWRLTIDRGTGDLYVGDVGQGAWEEVTVANAPDRGRGADYGWNNCEGNHSFSGRSCPGSLPAAIDYDHGDGCAVVGGYVYRGCLMPGYHGTYFYSDNCGAWVRTFIWSGTAATSPATDDDLSGEVGSPGTFGEDARGELYVGDVGGGRVYRIVPQ
jgi:glucose/arabinose dehydrogenase